jgi:hypothetical protein
MQPRVDHPDPKDLKHGARPALTDNADGRLLALVRLLARQAAHEWLASPAAVASGNGADA